MKFPPRIHVLVPRNAETAVVIRRGPSKETCILSWNTNTGDVSVSQWLKGRIYERRSDISPDGKYWIYFAMNGRWDSPVKGSWTAVARAPWLKAIALFAKGDCWHGGGLFIERKTFWLNDGYGHEAQLSTNEVARKEDINGLQNYGGECLTPYYNRLQRDGWKLVSRDQKNRHDSLTIFEKSLVKGWTLRKLCHEQIGAPKGKGCYWDEHTLTASSGEQHLFPDWEWAEIVNDRIVFAEHGCLFRRFVRSAKAISEPILIHDFSDHKFERIKAPY